MTDRKILYNGLTGAAWGYFLLYVDFNIGPVSILPRFAGYLMLLGAIRDLSGERRDLILLRPLGTLLAAWNAGDWLLSWGGLDIDGHILFADLLIAAAQLYFHFQFLTDMAALAELYCAPEGRLDLRILRKRNLYVLLITGICLIQTVNGGFGSAVWSNGAAVILMILAILLSIALMVNLFALRACFKEEEVRLSA